jgi:hypothetical protein
MIRNALALTVACALLLLCAVRAQAQETITEPSTEKVFPAQVKISDGGSEYTLKATGTSVRKKFFFKVYGIVHYMQDAPKGKEDEVFKAILADGKAKQITMEFARNVSVGQIQDAYKESFSKCASAEEMKEISPYVAQFTGYFDKDVKENDVFVLRWLPGGKIVATLIGKENPPIVNMTFARVLWTIWLGEDSIVDRDDLVGKLTGN